MAACPELLPSYRRLAPHLQDRVRRGIGTGFNLMQFAQGESLPASLLSLRRLARDRDGPRLCRFALLLWILRVPAFWRVPGLLKNMRGAIEALLRGSMTPETVNDVGDALCERAVHNLALRCANTYVGGDEVSQVLAERHLATALLRWTALRSNQQ